MAIAELLSKQLTPGARNYPIDFHGKLRIAYWEIETVAVAGDAPSTIEMVRLPFGRLRLFPHMSRISLSALGASRVLDIGYRAFDKSDGSEEAESANALANDLDVSGATNSLAISTVLKYDFFSRKGVTLFGTIAGGTLPVGATARGLFVYAVE